MGLNIKALHDRVFVKRIDPVAQTDSGIIIPEAAQKSQLMGTVLAIGPGLIKADGDRSPMEVKVGDTVVFPDSYGWEAEVEGEKVTILREKDIMAVVES